MLIQNVRSVTCAHSNEAHKSFVDKPKLNVCVKVSYQNEQVMYKVCQNMNIPFLILNHHKLLGGSIWTSLHLMQKQKEIMEGLAHQFNVFADRNIPPFPMEVPLNSNNL